MFRSIGSSGVSSFMVYLMGRSRRATLYMQCGVSIGLLKDVYIRRILRSPSISPAQKGRGSQDWVGEVILNRCPEIDFQEYIRRLVFCVVSGNTDEHLKNWSLRYPDMRLARLSPAYDLAAVSTSYPQFRNAKLTLPIAGQNETRLITLRHFQEFAENLGANVDVTTVAVRDTVQRLKETWPRINNDPQTPEFVKEHVDNRVRYLPLMHG